MCSVLAGLVLSHGVQARLRRDACVTGTCAAAWCVRNAADWTLALGIYKDIMQALVVPSGCFVLAATVLLVLLCFTGSDCVLHQLPRVLGQPRQIRTRANPSCAPIPRVLASFEHVRVPCGLVPAGPSVRMTAEFEAKRWQPRLRACRQIFHAVRPPECGGCGWDLLGLAVRPLECGGCGCSAQLGRTDSPARAVAGILMVRPARPLSAAAVAGVFMVRPVRPPECGGCGWGSSWSAQSARPSAPASAAAAAGGWSLHGSCV